MFKFPSLTTVLQSAFAAVLRFPLVMASAVLGTLSALYIIHFDHYPFDRNYESASKVIMCCSLGLNLFLAGILFSDSRRQAPAIRYALQGGILVLLGAYFFSLPDFKEFSQVHIARFILFLIGAHLLVAIAPFIGRGTINGFWQFNKTLFLRILTSALYTGVLYLGLVLALLAIDQLFKVHISWRWYMDLWWILTGVFNTWFFLAGVPSDIEGLDTVNEYPKGLKIFTQFVLLPLVTLYLVILYAYAVKIVVEMQLPKGWVSYLVIGFSGAGILSLLLIYPIRDEEGNAWIRNFSRWFYRALYPLIVLLGLSIYKRVHQYGITENRYFIILLALWLAAIATYFLLSKVKNIRAIPVSLCLIAFLSSFGPWGAFSISERSQTGRLEALLMEAKILVNGKIQKTKDTVSAEQAEQITSIVRYLDDIKRLERLQPWFSKDLDSLFQPKTEDDYVNRPALVLDAMGVPEYYDYGYYDENEGERVVQYYFYSSEYGSSIYVKGYDYYLPSYYFYYNDKEYNKGELMPASPEQYLVMGGDSMELSFRGKPAALCLENRGKLILEVKLDDFIGRIRKEIKTMKGAYGQGTSANLEPAKMRIEAGNDSLQLQFNFQNITLEGRNDTITFSNGNTSVLFKRINHAGGN